MIIYILIGIMAIDKSEKTLNYFLDKKICEISRDKIINKEIPLAYCQEGVLLSDEQNPQ